MRKTIKKSIGKLIKTFSKHPHIFLTEDDVRCYLFFILSNINPGLLDIQETGDDSFSTSIHSEVRWYGDGKLRYLSDIALLDPKSLRVKDKASLRVYTKGYAFNSYYGIIEIKLRRINGYSSNRLLKEIKKDIEKLKKIKRETKFRNKIKNPLYCLVCLDKKSNIKSKVKDVISPMIKSEGDIFFHYVFGDKAGHTNMRGDISKKPTQETSRRMRRIKGRGTKLEKRFASLLRGNKIKYQSQPKLFGKPDFRVKNSKILIFCDSSFWHGRRRKEITGEAFRVNKGFWKEKLLYNKNKDKRVNRVLRQRGWTVVRFWDDEILKHPNRVLKKLNKYVKTSK